MCRFCPEQQCAICGSALCRDCGGCPSHDCTCFDDRVDKALDEAFISDLVQEEDE